MKAFPVSRVMHVERRQISSKGPVLWWMLLDCNHRKWSRSVKRPRPNQPCGQCYLIERQHPHCREEK